MTTTRRDDAREAPGLERRTLAHVLERAARVWPAKPAVCVPGDRELTYAQLLAQARRFASALELHAPAARHVGVLLPNGADFLVGLYGAALAGRTAVLLNPRLRDPELVYQLGQAEVDVVVAADAPGRPMASLFPALTDAGLDPTVVWAGDSEPPAGTGWDGWTAAARSRAESGLPAEEDTAVIIYTSGSTALPKGVMLAHHSVVHNAELVAARFGATDRDRVFCAGPFFHSGGLTLQVVLSAICGATAYSVRSFDATEVVEIVEREEITVYSGIETLFLRLAEARGFRRERLASIRTGWSTGTPGILKVIADELGVEGVMGVYGITEASPNVTMPDWDDTRERRLNTIGRAQDETEIRLVDAATGDDVGTGEPGELLVRGYGLMQGYYNKPDETATALRDGWLHTGDLAVRREDGYFTFAGRIKDIVRVDGENVSCAEVEDAIYGLGDVELAAVIPVEDDSHGQIAVAAVRLSDRAAFSEEDMIRRLRRTLAGYKVPRRIVPLDEMPLTESGKVQKGRLTEVVRPMLQSA
jgi:acyl-CoA synthetase (AMP-forming)/AMP-acid ligase II